MNIYTYIYYTSYTYYVYIENVQSNWIKLIATIYGTSVKNFNLNGYIMRVKLNLLWFNLIRVKNWTDLCVYIDRTNGLIRPNFVNMNKVMFAIPNFCGAVY